MCVCLSVSLSVCVAVCVAGAATYLLSLRNPPQPRSLSLSLGGSDAALLRFTNSGRDLAGQKAELERAQWLTREHTLFNPEERRRPVTAPSPPLEPHALPHAARSRPAKCCDRVMHVLWLSRAPCVVLLSLALALVLHQEGAYVMLAQAPPRALLNPEETQAPAARALRVSLLHRFPQRSQRGSAERARQVAGGGALEGFEGEGKVKHKVTASLQSLLDQIGFPIRDSVSSFRFAALEFLACVVLNDARG